MYNATTATRIKEQLINEFGSAISRFTLKFRDELDESQYMQRRLSSSLRSYYVRFTFLIFSVVAVWRMLEAFFDYDIYAQNTIFANHVALLSCFVASILLEILFIYRLKVLRGVLSMIVCYMVIFYLSYSTLSNPAGIMHVYLLSVVT